MFSKACIPDSYILFWQRDVYFATVSDSQHINAAARGIRTSLPMMLCGQLSNLWPAPGRNAWCCSIALRINTGICELQCQLLFFRIQYSPSFTNRRFNILAKSSVFCLFRYQLSTWNDGYSTKIFSWNTQWNDMNKYISHIYIYRR